ncbi:MAG: 50S ribosomal protein L10 [Candidatus Omnitrophica bacterium]|nr:50S ribosomal protein L10 [Candidatus Omnitrophota bacterium]
MAHIEKNYMVKQINQHLKDASGLIVANFENLKAVEINALRRKLEKNSSRLFLTKNTLLRRVFSEFKCEEISKYLQGKSGVAICRKDPVSVAKTLFDFSKEHETFKVRGGVVDGEFINESKTKELSELPSKDILRATVLMRMKSPISGLVNVLNGSIRGLVVALNQINKQKEGKSG